MWTHNETTLTCPFHLVTTCRTGTYGPAWAAKVILLFSLFSIESEGFFLKSLHTKYRPLGGNISDKKLQPVAFTPHFHWNRPSVKLASPTMLTVALRWNSLHHITAEWPICNSTIQMHLSIQQWDKARHSPPSTIHNVNEPSEETVNFSSLITRSYKTLNAPLHSGQPFISNKANSIKNGRSKTNSWIESEVQAIKLIRFSVLSLLAPFTFCPWGTSPSSAGTAQQSTTIDTYVGKSAAHLVLNLLWYWPSTQFQFQAKTKLSTRKIK